MGLCQHSMSRLQIADGEKASSVESRCEYIEKRSCGQPTGGDPPTGVMGEVLIKPRREIWPCYETDTFASGLDWSFCMT
jgi:hypothetical protein